MKKRKRKKYRKTTTTKNKQKKKGFCVRLINCFAHVFRAKCLPERINPTRLIQSATQPASQPVSQPSNQPTNQSTNLGKKKNEKYVIICSVHMQSEEKEKAEFCQSISSMIVCLAYG